MCPRGRQTMFFSATISENVAALANLSLNSPVQVKVDRLYSNSTRLQQEFVRLKPKHEHEREATLLSLVSRTFKERVILALTPTPHPHSHPSPSPYPLPLTLTLTPHPHPYPSLGARHRVLREQEELPPRQDPLRSRGPARCRAARQPHAAAAAAGARRLANPNPNPNPNPKP